MLANPWVLLGALLAVLGIAGGAYYQGRQDGAAAVRSQHARQLAELQAKVDAADARYRARSAELSQAEAQIGELLAWRPDPRVLTREIVREVPVDAPCSCPDRSPEYRRLYNGIAAGRAPEGSPGAMPPAPANPAAVPPARLVGLGQP